MLEKYIDNKCLIIEYMLSKLGIIDDEEINKNMHWGTIKTLDSEILSLSV